MRRRRLPGQVGIMKKAWNVIKEYYLKIIGPPLPKDYYVPLDQVEENDLTSSVNADAELLKLAPQKKGDSGVI